MAKNDDNTKSDIKSPSLDGMDLVPKLGGMPKTMTPEEIMKANCPADRSPAPGSFRPSERASDGEKA